MTPRIARRIAWSLVAVYILLAVIGLTLQFLTNTSYTDIAFPALLIIVPLIGIWPVIGALIISRHPRHPVGWLLSVGLLVAAFDMFFSGYVTYDINMYSGVLPGFSIGLLWLMWSGFPFATTAFTLMILLFPDGRPPSPFWRKVAWAAVGTLLIYLPIQAVHPGAVDPFTGILLNNPFAVSSASWTILEPFWLVGLVMLALCNLAAVISLILRLRRAKGDEHQQIKWLVIPAVGHFASIPFTILALVETNAQTLGIAIALALLSVAGMVIATAFAIFKYRLYDIDILINRTLVYGTLTACVVGLYVLVVGAFGTFFQAQGNLIIALLATGLIAVLFQPLRERLQRGVNRLIYGERDNPIEALARLGKQMEVALPFDQVLPSLVKTIAQTLKLPYVGIKQKDHPDISFGHETDSPVSFPFIFQGETTGVLLASPRSPGESFSSAEMNLLQNLARQAGVVVRNAQLTADLQRSRQNLVTAREEERHRLRRDLHDGIGPTMAGLTLKLDAARDLVSSNLESGRKEELEEAMQLLTELKSQTQESVQNIRHIVHTLRPPSLDVLGLVPALQAHFGQVATPRRLNIQMTTAPQRFPRFSAAVEVAAYRIILESVTNVINHAQAEICKVSLSLENGDLKIEVKDDGIGLPKTHKHGIGLDSMRERAEELGGRLEFSSSPQGTRVCAEIPIAPARSKS